MIDWQSFAAGVIVGTTLSIMGEILLVIVYGLVMRWAISNDVEPD